MKQKYIIGIDGGTQSSKVSIFDLEGKTISQARVNLKPIHMPKPGVAEHPGDDLWDSVIQASRAALADFPGEPDELIGVGLGSIRCCRADLKKDGTLASPVLSWMDLRLSRPYEHVNPEVAYVTTTTGYLTHRFTGERRDTASNYEGPWPIDKENWCWIDDPEAFAAYKIPREMLFELKMPGDILGYVTPGAAALTGIPEGLPVVATANDKAVEALGAGLEQDGTVLVSLGTYIGGMVYGEENRPEAQHYFSNMACVPGHYLYESGGIRKGMWTVSWFLNTLGADVVQKARDAGLSPEDFISREAEQVPAGSDGLMTVPEWLAPPSIPYKKGIMLGFDGRHTRAHIYRSILEAIALTMKNHVDTMAEELGLELHSLIVSGGGSNGDLFMQIFADVFGLTARRNLVNSAAGLGAAICVAVATGVYDSFGTAVDRMVRIKDHFEPIPKNVEVYEKLNQGAYKYITECTDQILERSYNVFQDYYKYN